MLGFLYFCTHCTFDKMVGGGYKMVENLCYMGFEVFVAMNGNMVFVWEVTPYSPVDRY